MGRMYTIPMDAVSVSVAKDLMRISVATNKIAILHEVVVTQDQSEVSEQLPFQLHRASTDGTGTAVIPEKLDPGDAAFSGTAAVNLTVDTTISGLLLHRESQNVLNGWTFTPTPEGRIVIPGGGRIVIRLDAAPAAALPMSISALIEEIG